jgi:hypothetical protein|tara:strand:+ start:2595 stop:3053 length:459 start_codon:yes stop_codon:yes gene_type:complete
MSALCVASLRFAPVAAASAPKNSAVRKATAAVGPSRNAAPIARLALASSSSLAVAPAAFAATEHGNAILQLADSLEDTIPTIAIYASLVRLDRVLGAVVVLRRAARHRYLPPISPSDTPSPCIAHSVPSLRLSEPRGRVAVDAPTRRRRHRR